MWTYSGSDILKPLKSKEMILRKTRITFVFQYDYPKKKMKSWNAAQSFAEYLKMNLSGSFAKEKCHDLNRRKHFGKCRTH